MYKILMYLLIGMCLIGQVLVTKHKRSGYLLWIIADGAWAVFNFSQWNVTGAIEQGILWTLYFIISVWGYLIFNKDKDIIIKTRHCPRCNNEYYGEKDENNSCKS